MWNLVVCKERLEKQGRVMDAMKIGMPDGQASIIIDAPSDLTTPFMIAGQLWAVHRIVPQAMRLGTPFWMIDNGYYKTSGLNQHETGHYEFTYRGLLPQQLRNPDYTRFPAQGIMKPWRPATKAGHIVIAFPGPTFGSVFGMDMRQWMATIQDKVRKVTNRPILIRHKSKHSRPIAQDLAGAHCLVTHSSHVAIEAIIMGIPTIVAPTSPAAPISSLSLDEIEEPRMEDRTEWWASLMSQQFTLKEMRSGLAWEWLQKIRTQAEEKTG
jgi:hypothetical protein